MRLSYKQLQEKYKDRGNLALPGNSNLWQDKIWSTSVMDTNYNQCSWITFYRFGNRHGQSRFEQKI